MNHLGLFEGIGGFSLGAKWAGGISTIAYSEIDPFCLQFLAKALPQAQSIGDITNADFTIFRGRIDVLTGGFPCQDASQANSHGSGMQGLGGG